MSWLYRLLIIMLAAMLIAASSVYAEDEGGLAEGATGEADGDDGKGKEKAPKIKKLRMESSWEPVAGESTPVNVSIRVHDSDGFEDIASVSVIVMKPDGETVHIAAGEAMPAGNGTGNARDYEYVFEMGYDDDPANESAPYQVRVQATDHSGLVSEVKNTTFTYGHVLSMSYSTTSIGFGSPVPGARSHIIEVIVTNTGNIPLDIETWGTDLTGPLGVSLGVDRVRFDLNGDSFDAEQTLSAEPVLHADFDLAPGDSRATYWVLDVPYGDTMYVPAGGYDGKVFIGAIAS